MLRKIMARFSKNNSTPPLVCYRDCDLVSPNGLQVFASAGPEKRPLPTATDQIIIVENSTFQRWYPCGHRGPRWFVLDTYGERTKKIKGNERCSVCETARLKKYCIRCSVCGLIILPGDGVAMYHKSSPGIKLDIATKVGDSVVGCVRWDCCPSGGFLAGNWSEQGFVPRFKEGITAAEHASHSQGMVVVEHI
jgi:hypothetical protein